MFPTRTLNVSPSAMALQSLQYRRHGSTLFSFLVRPLLNCACRTHPSSIENKAYPELSLPHSERGNSHASISLLLEILAFAAGFRSSSVGELSCFDSKCGISFAEGFRSSISASWEFDLLSTVSSCTSTK